MQIKNFLSLILCLFFLISCQKDEENDELIGTWKLINSSIVTELPNNGLFLEPRILDNCQKQEIVVFNKTTYISYSYETQAEGSCLESIVEVPYSYSDRKLMFSIGGKSYTLTVDAGGGSLQILSDLEDNKKLQKIYRKQ
ncbi:MAG: lipocalin family protein [Capnocytophaga sp.]|nr:lipocalin family protein [Capnocytophaga sp.]